MRPLPDAYRILHDQPANRADGPAVDNFSADDSWAWFIPSVNNRG